VLAVSIIRAINVVMMEVVKHLRNVGKLLPDNMVK
jgi:hypothetical protein